VSQKQYGLHQHGFVGNEAPVSINKLTTYMLHSSSSQHEGTSPYFIYVFAYY